MTDFAKPVIRAMRNFGASLPKGEQVKPRMFHAPLVKGLTCSFRVSVMFFLKMSTYMSTCNFDVLESSFLSVFFNHCIIRSPSRAYFFCLKAPSKSRALFKQKTKPERRQTLML